VNREDVVWGLVGGLSFLVLITAYELLTRTRASLVVTLGVAVAVGVVVAVASAVIAS